MMRMILLITNKDDITVDFIIQRLKACGYTYYRLNTEDIKLYPAEWTLIV